ncbi:SAM-dependent DNA methyltransferase [Dietzia cinnamea]|uniref:SAM-dependent DNA methyltransferase n=1 Tax=Dietzia cinnamea TaxID=321318 RepID=UPI003CFDD490
MTTTPMTSLDVEEVECLVKSRERVKAYGEVFTPQAMVQQMLDLVSTELERGPGFVDKTFLEPSAGDGNFLIAILRRKLAAIEKRYPSDQWPTESLFALASIYGIELLPDNHALAKAGMLAEFAAFHQRLGIKCTERTNLWRSATFIADTNIRQGNTLTGLDPFGGDIEFSWWHRLPDQPGTVQREPFTFSSLRGASSGMLAFDVLPTYEPCRIDRVHQEKIADV